MSVVAVTPRPLAVRPRALTVWLPVTVVVFVRAAVAADAGPAPTVIARNDVTLMDTAATALRGITL